MHEIKSTRRPCSFNHHANPVKTICHLTVQTRFVLTYRKEKSYALFPIDQPSKDCVLCFGCCEGILALSHDTKKVDVKLTHLNFLSNEKSQKASIAKLVRHHIVAVSIVGSSPIIRPKHPLLAILYPFY